jgi:hypothetical protein
VAHVDRSFPAFPECTNEARAWARKLRSHFPEFLTAFRYRCPALRTIAINMYFRIEPTCVIEGASLDKSEARHDGEIRENWRPAFRAKIPLNWLTTIASVVKGFESSSNRHCRFWNSYQYRESSSRLLLAMSTMAHPDEGGIGIRGIPNLVAEAATSHLNHFALFRLVSVAAARQAPLNSGNTKSPGMPKISWAPWSFSAASKAWASVGMGASLGSPFLALCLPDDRQQIQSD